MTEPDHTHVVNNGKRDLTLDELALMQPGMDRLMAEIGQRCHRLYYAGKAGNWPLAEYYLRSVFKQLKLCATSRPKYAEDIDAYINEDCVPLRDAIRRRDPAAFETTYATFVDRANYYHDVWKKPWLHWVTPSEPPADLDLTAGMSDG